jgi:hypothetical protein
MALTDHQATVDRKTRAPEDIVTPADRDAAIQAAVLRYSQDRPLRRVVEVTVLADENEIALPPTWASGESVLLSVEAPTGEVPPSLLDVAAYAIVARPNGDALLISDTFSAATQCRLTFTGPHVVSAATDTVPARDREALGYWAAAILCDQVAAHHAENLLRCALDAAVIDGLLPANPAAAVDVWVAGSRPAGRAVGERA